MIREFFRHGSNAALAVALAALGGAFALGVWQFSAPLALAGAMLFFCSEYTTHRFLFHARPSRVRWVLNLQHRLHYDHHVDPPKLDLLFLPWWFVLPSALAFFCLYLAATRSVAASTSLLFGSLIGLAFYEWVHYVAHVSFVPRTPFGRYMKKYHLWHHFKNERLWYGVTNPTMDYAMHTYGDVATAERSTTVREIWRGTDI